MAAPAFSPLQWATASPPASTVIPAQLRLDGYASYDPFTASQANRLFYEIGEWLDYLNTEGAAPFAIEHYATATTDAYGTAIAAGTHEDIVADSVVIRGEGSGAGQGGRLEFRDAGRASDNTATIGVGAVLAETVILQVDAIGGAVNVELELVGGVFRSTLAASAAWAVEVNQGTDQTLYVRNIGAGNADLDVDGDATVHGSLIGESGTLTCTDQLAAQGGLAAGFDSDNCAFRYLGASRQTFEQDISPWAGSWSHGEMDSAGTPDVPKFMTDTPPYVTPNGTAYVMMARALSFGHNTDNVPNSTALRLLTRIKLRYYRAAAGDLITFQIVRVKRDGSAAPDVMFEYDEATELSSTAAWTQYDSGAIVGTSFEPATYYYSARLKLTHSSSVRVADIMLEWEARHVEAAPL